VCVASGADPLISRQLHTLGHTCKGGCICTRVDLGNINGGPIIVVPDCPAAGHSGAVHAVAFSPDGRTFASGSADAYGCDNTVRVWDVATGAQECTPVLLV